MTREVVLKQDGLRLDKAIAEEMPDVSRSNVQQWIREGRVSSGGQTVKASAKSQSGQLVTIDLPEPVSDDMGAENIPLDVIYEDDALMVINKPQGMVVHPGAGHHSGTLVNALLYYSGEELSDVNEGERRGIVHRLDKDTSGLLLVAKTNLVHRRLAAALQKHEIVRIYETIVYGHFGEKAGIVDAPIARDKQNRQRMATAADGRPARTHFRLVSSLQHGSYLRVRLETGRTHQIRVHMKFIGHPVVADPIYAPNRENFGLSGQCLHAAELTFVHPLTKEAMRFTAPLPDWFTQTLDRLGYDESQRIHWPEEWPDEEFDE